MLRALGYRCSGARFFATDGSFLPRTTRKLLAGAPVRSFASLQKVIFTANGESDAATREGSVKSFGEHHGNIKLKLEKHPGHGGKGGGTNPEELLSLGYAACFNGRSMRSVPVLPLPVSRQTQHAPLHRWLDTLAHDARCPRPRLSSRPIIDDFDYSRPIQPPSQVPFALSRRKTTSRLASQLFKHPSVSAWCRRSSQPAFRCESVWRRRSMRPLPASTMQQRPS